MDNNIIDSDSEIGSESDSENETKENRDDDVSDYEDEIESDNESDVDIDNENENEDSKIEALISMDMSDNDEEDDDLDENYLQKLDKDVNNDIISNFHPEILSHNVEEVETACRIVRDENGNIVDPLHKTLPFVTRYEKARVLGERAKQINSGAQPFVPVDNMLIDGYLIALQEFEQKKIPFIIRRPLPNGCSEYWRLSDLDIL